MTPLLAEIMYVVSHKEKTHPGAFGGKGAYATAYGEYLFQFDLTPSAIEVGKFIRLRGMHNMLPKSIFKEVNH